MARPVRKKPIKVENLSTVAKDNKQPPPMLNLSPSGKVAVSFWTSITNDELHALRSDKPLLTELQKLVLQDAYFYLARTEPNGISVFANSKGSIALPVSSFKIGTCVHM